MQNVPYFGKLYSIIFYKILSLSISLLKFLFDYCWFSGTLLNLACFIQQLLNSPINSKSLSVESFGSHDHKCLFSAKRFHLTLSYDSYTLFWLLLSFGSGWASSVMWIAEVMAGIHALTHGKLAKPYQLKMIFALDLPVLGKGKLF